MTLIELILNVLFFTSIIMLFGNLFGAAAPWWLIILLSLPMIFACLPMWIASIMNCFKGKNLKK